MTTGISLHPMGQEVQLQGLVRRRPMPLFTQRLLTMALVALPFTAALTLQVGFPLKIYEVLICLVILLLPLGRITVPQAIWREIRLLAAFVILSAILLALIMGFTPAMSLGRNVVYRFGPLGDGLTALAYLVLNVISFFLFTLLAYHHPTTFLNGWFTGTVLSALYAWYLMVQGVTGANLPLLPGTLPQYAVFAGKVFLRGGTFPEGNHYGLYLILSLALAVHARRRLLSYFLLITVLTTFSTIAFAGLLLFAVLANFAFFPKIPLQGKVLLLVCLAMLVGAAAVVFMQLGYWDSIFTEKFSPQGASYSLPDRLDVAIVGLQMFLDNPITGVGIGQYSYHYYTYSDWFINTFGSSIDSAVMLPARIPNNVYVEVLSEQGLFAFLLFVLFLSSLIARTRHRSMRILRYGLFIMLIVFLAYPGYSFMFLWAFWAYLLGTAMHIQRIVNYPLTMVQTSDAP